MKRGPNVNVTLAYSQAETVLLELGRVETESDDSDYQRMMVSICDKFRYAMDDAMARVDG